MTSKTINRGRKTDQGRGWAWERDLFAAYEKGHSQSKSFLVKFLNYLLQLSLNFVWFDRSRRIRWLRSRAWRLCSYRIRAPPTIPTTTITRTCSCRLIWPSWRSWTTSKSCCVAWERTSRRRAGKRSRYFLCLYRNFWDGPKTRNENCQKKH